MLPLLDDKIVFISGGSQGLGAAIARAAVREGAQAVVVTGRRREPGEKLVAELSEQGATARFVQADVSDVASAQAAVQAAVDEFGRVDCLVNSAGLTSRGTLLDTTPELFDAHIAINLRGPYFTMQAVVRDMVRRKAPGTIVNVISIAELGGQPYLSPYVADKAGLAGATRNDPQRRIRPSLGSHPHQRPRHRMDRLRGRGRHPAGVPRRGRRLARKGRRVRPHGQAGPGRRDRRLRRLPLVGPQRRGHRFDHRLGPDRRGRLGLIASFPRLELP